MHVVFKTGHWIAVIQNAGLIQYMYVKRGSIMQSEQRAGEALIQAYRNDDTVRFLREVVG